MLFFIIKRLSVSSPPVHAQDVKADLCSFARVTDQYTVLKIALTTAF